MNSTEDFKLSCPTELKNFSTIQLAHGGGGKLMNELLENIILPHFKNSLTEDRHDGAVFKIGGTRLAFTTDSYVINPLFFQGGDIGSLAIHGTVNDLAMCGAKPLYLSAAFIIEEGFDIAALSKIVESMKISAHKAGVKLITGDTKVVDRGKGDGIFINTSGTGIIEHDLNISPSQIKPGDVIIVNGDIGRHGISVMAKREGISFESTIESDSAELASLTNKLLTKGINISCMRDLTRGGLASALVELSETAKIQIEINEKDIPVREDVKGACEVLGFDPIYVANEGRFICFVPEDEASKALKTMRTHPEGKGACVIGKVLPDRSPSVTMKSILGTERIIDMMSGEQLPRIC